jgi:hypothetical protein
MGQPTGEFVRDTRYVNARITVDGREGWPLRDDVETRAALREH